MTTISVTDPQSPPAPDRERERDLPRGAIMGGLIALVAILAVAGAVLLLNLPSADAFDDRVARLFVENNDLTSQAEIKLLEILAQSGSAFADVLASYRLVIFVLLLSSTALLVTSLAFLVILTAMRRRVAELEGGGIRIQSLHLDRETRTVRLDDMEFQLTDAAMETLSVLAEARLDGDLLSGAEIEAMITGKDAADCDEASGITRIKRLRDALGGQIVAALLVRTVARKGYGLSIAPESIKLE